jgi:2-polyprenyl-3-methyl-5-hydroxy-6-metoxy-1,4-benzoquinol methylase
MSNFEYSGTELSLFECANNWKTYWSKQIFPHIGNSILEVGAGIGATAKTLNANQYAKWVCLEPDVKLCEEIRKKINAGTLPRSLDIRTITTEQLDSQERFDTILYIDVLEHIKNDKAGLEKVVENLADGGAIIIVSPSHNFLYSKFDANIGHHRRYNKKMLYSIIPSGMKVRKMRYLDSIGLFASLANKLILKSANPTHKQIQVWDRFMVTASRFLDPLLGYRFGKSIVCIIEKSDKV